jgi:DNA-binding MarR family transcriptional regulator
MSIARTGDILNRYLEIELAKHGSSPIRFAVMNALFVHGGVMVPTAIGKWTFRAKHTVSSMLSALEAIGLLQRKPNQSDGRSVNVMITEKGWEATKRMIPLAEDVSQRALSCLDEEQIDTLMSLLRFLRKHLLKQISHSQPVKAHRLPGKGVNPQRE